MTRNSGLRPITIAKKHKLINIEQIFTLNKIVKSLDRLNKSLLISLDKELTNKDVDPDSAKKRIRTDLDPQHCIYSLFSLSCINSYFQDSHSFTD